MRRGGCVGEGGEGVGQGARIVTALSVRVIRSLYQPDHDRRAPLAEGGLEEQSGDLRHGADLDIILPLALRTPNFNVLFQHRH